MHRDHGWCPLFLVYLCHCACLIFFSKSTSMHVAKNSYSEAFVGLYFTIPKLTCKRSGLYGSQKLVFLVGACTLLRTSCAGLFCLAARLMPSHVHPSCTLERALLCTKGFCGAYGEATARGVN